MARKREVTSDGEVAVNDGSVVLSFPAADSLRITMTPSKARWLAAELVKHAHEAVMTYEFKRPPGATT